MYPSARQLVIIVSVKVALDSELISEAKGDLRKLERVAPREALH